MNTSPRSRFRRLISAPLAAAFVAVLAQPAAAQPTTRGAPVLRTPGQAPAPTPAAPAGGAKPAPP
ncbi:MAG: hypothetical protein ABI134_24340, partial [Byssovorax sp.]